MCVSPWTIHFRQLDESPLSGVLRGGGSLFLQQDLPALSRAFGAQGILLQGKGEF